MSGPQKDFAETVRTLLPILPAALCAEVDPEIPQGPRAGGGVTMYRTRTEWEASELFAFLVRLPDRCRACAAHVKLQVHRPDCPLVPR